jgi:hypothetical protein
MIRNFKALGLALIAVFAMSAVVASAASAAEFKSEAATTFIQGKQSTENVFTVNSRTVKCTGAEFTGKQEGTSVVNLNGIHPTYTGCTAFGLESTVTTTGCNYDFTASSATAGAVKVNCEAGKNIVVNAAGVCIVEIGTQTPAGGVDYTNQGSGTSRSVLVTSTAKEITATVTGPLLTCGTNGVRTNGTYTGTVSTKGYKNAGFTEQVGVWVE